MNPVSLVFIAFCAVVGALLGHVLIGLALGLAFCLAASL